MTGLASDTIKIHLFRARRANFARYMAAQVATAPAKRQANDTLIESIMLAILAVVMLMVNGVVVASYGSTWLPAFRALLALGACLGAS